MADTAARLALAAWRNDDVFEVPIRVRGVDLSVLALAMQIRLGPDTPGDPLVDLAKVTTTNTQGLRVAGVSTVDGVPTSDLRIRINKSTLRDLPYSGEIGDAAALSYALLIGGRTRLVGEFAVLAHAFGSDTAPVNRPAGLGVAKGAAPSAGATLTVSADGGATVTIDGADMLGGLVQAAAAEKAAAGIASDAAQQWAEGSGEPGGAGSRSAKAWAGDASATIGAGLTTIAQQTGLATGAAASAALSATSALALSDLYPTQAAGLAATAEGGYFGVPTGGNAFAEAFRKVGGAAVSVGSYPSLALVRTLGSVPNLVSGDPSVDCAIAINAELANPLVTRVILPPGTFWVRRGIAVPPGKELDGAGWGVTILKAHASFAASTGGLFTAMVQCKDSVTSIVRNFTCDGNKITGVQLKGVVMYRAIDFLVQRVECININSYAFWAVSIFGDAVRPRGRFSMVRSINCNVHFECSRGDGVTFEDMEWSGGDGDIDCEAVYHALSGARNVFFRKGRQIGPGGGVIIDVLANENEPTENVRFEDCDGFAGTNTLAVQIEATFAGQRCNNIEIIECDLGGTSNIYAKAASVRIVSSRLDIRTAEGIIADGATVDIVDTELKLTSAPGSAAFPFTVTNGGKVTVSGGRIWYHGDTRFTAYGAGQALEVSPTTKVVTGSTGGDLIAGETPIGVGAVVERVTVGDQVMGDNDVLGAGGLFQFGAGQGASYRVQLAALIAAPASGVTGVRTQVSGATAEFSGQGSISRTIDEVFAGVTKPMYAQDGNTNAVFGTTGAGKKVAVNIDIVLRATDNLAGIQLISTGGGTLFAGSRFRVQRLA